MELGAFIAQGSAGTVVDQALACLLGLLGLRISEALHIDIEHLGIQRGHRTVTVLGKGSKLAVIPLPPRVARAVDLAAGERTSGPLLLGRTGERLNRQAATRIVVRLAKQAGVCKHISPHSLRHRFITAALDAGVPLRDVQIAARHADPRTTTRYDRARNNLDRHASYTSRPSSPAHRRGRKRRLPGRVTLEGAASPAPQYGKSTEQYVLARLVALRGVRGRAITGVPARGTPIPVELADVA